MKKISKLTLLFLVCAGCKTQPTTVENITPKIDSTAQSQIIRNPIDALGIKIRNIDKQLQRKKALEAKVKRLPELENQVILLKEKNYNLENQVQSEVDKQNGLKTQISDLKKRLQQLTEEKDSMNAVINKFITKLSTFDGDRNE